MVHVQTAMSGVRNSKKIITCKIFITCSISRVVMNLPSRTDLHGLSEPVKVERSNENERADERR